MLKTFKKRLERDSFTFAGARRIVANVKQHKLLEQREAQLQEAYGSFSWRKRGWRTQWIMQHFLWPTLIYYIVTDAIFDWLVVAIYMLTFGWYITYPLLALGLVLGHFAWR